MVFTSKPYKSDHLNSLHTNKPSHPTAWESCTASTTPAVSNTNWSRKSEVRLSTTTWQGIAAVCSNGFRRLMRLFKSTRVTAYDGRDQGMKMGMEMYDSSLETDEVEEEEEAEEKEEEVEEKEEDEEEKEEDDEEREGSDEEDDVIIDDIDVAFDRAAYVPSVRDEEDDGEVSIEDEKGESGEDYEIENEDEDRMKKRAIGAW